VRKSLEVLLVREAEEYPVSEDTEHIEPAVLLDGLSEAIYRADPEIIQEALHRLRRHGRPEDFDPALLQVLETQIGRYDYDQAKETIAQIRMKLKEAA
jgi:hypothetical protein